MKILLITWACDRDDVSEPQIAYRWVRGIAQRHEVTLFSVSRPDRFGCVKEQFPDLTVIEWCDIRVPNYLERFRSIAKPGYFFYFKKARKLIQKLIQQNSYDLIHHLNPFAWRYASPAYGLGLPLVRGPVAGGLPTPKPLCNEIREAFHPYKFLRKSDGLRKKIDRTLRNSYLLTDCVLGGAPYILDLIKPLPVKRFEVEIEHGLDHIEFVEEFERNCTNKEKVQLLFVGRVIRTKGARDAIRAVSRMKNKENISFTIIGDGDDLPSCLKEIRELNLTSIITCAGWCNSKQIEIAYRDADIFVFPSFREPTGGVLLEAMSHGLPCITCNYGGPAYLVNEGCGLKILPNEPEEYAQNIADALDFLVENRKIRQEMGKNAFIYAQREFDWKKKMARLDAIYSSLISE